jgi:hypothetical protein
MKPLNPGNLYSFYLSNKWQFHRQPGCNRIPFGLTCPATRLIPFQFYSPTGSSPTVSWDLVDPADDTTVHALDSGQLEVVDKDGGGYWVTWYANEDVSSPPECGYWQTRLTVNGTEYWGNVLLAKGVCGSESGSLSLGACAISDDLNHMEVLVSASISAVDGYTYLIQRWNGSSWATVSTNAPYTTFEANADEAAQYKLVINSACGSVIEYEYDMEWTAATPCATVSLTQTGSMVTPGTAPTETQWRIRFSNGIDLGTVLYQNEYQQHFYPEVIAWDVPETEREEEVRENLDGVEILRSSRVRTRQVLEVPNLPDYCLAFLAEAADLETVVLEDVDSGDSITITGFQFTTRRQDVGFSICIFKFVSETVIKKNCQANFELA